MNQQVILITGCSTGLGHSLAKTLSASGYQVIATARNKEALTDLPVALKLALDVTQQESVNGAINTVLDKFGRIDVLINNSGYSVRAAVEETDEQLAREMFDVNVWGLLRVTKAVLPSMRERRKGRIIHIGSVVGKFAFPLNGGYAASKHAVEALSDAMRVELKLFNIDVVLIEPGTINTNFFVTSKMKSEQLVDNINSPYKSIYDRFNKLAKNSSFAGADPADVSEIVKRAIEVKHPKPRYLATIGLLYRLMLSLGDRNQDRLMVKVFGIRK